MQERLGVNQPGHHPAGAAVAGAAATVFHDAVMTPMDVVKQRLQLGYHKGMLDCMLTLQRTEGAQVGFFHLLSYEVYIRILLMLFGCWLYAFLLVFSFTGTLCSGCDRSHVLLFKLLE